MESKKSKLKAITPRSLRLVSRQRTAPAVTLLQPQGLMARFRALPPEGQAEVIKAAGTIAYCFVNYAMDMFAEGISARVARNLGKML